MMANKMIAEIGGGKADGMSFGFHGWFQWSYKDTACYRSVKIEFVLMLHFTQQERSNGAAIARSRKISAMESVAQP
jgi:hypothetical protein